MGFFASIVELLSGLRRAIDGLATTIRDSTERASQLNSAPEPGAIQIQRDTIAAEGRVIAHRTYRAVAAYTVLTFILLVVSAIASCVQHNDATTALKQANAGWLVIFLHALEYSLPDSEGNRIAHGIAAVLNRGPTPVTDVHIRIIVRRLEEGAPALEDFEHGTNALDPPVIYPDIPVSSDPLFHTATATQYPVWYLEKSPKGLKNTAKKVSPAEYEAITSDREVLVTYSRITYRDEFGDRHDIHSCAFNHTHPELFSAPRDDPDPKSADNVCIRFNAIDPKEVH